jgi:hypothetical protein
VKRRTRNLLIILGAVLAVLGGGIYWFFKSTPMPRVMKGTHFNCWTIGQCSEDCSRRCPDGLHKYPCMLKCDERCDARGCPSGRKRYKTLTRCVRRHCLWKCIGGPSPPCYQCSAERCGALQQACRDHRC